MSTVRSWLVAMTVAAGVIAMSLAGSPGAEAVSYRYWSYWVQAGSGWEFSQRGPASTVPADGTTEGWRFAISSESAGGAAPPRMAATAAFAQFCSGRTAKRTQKRVAVVLDFGTTAHAPSGQVPPPIRGTCAIVPKNATGAQVLTAAARVRSNQSGLVCAVDGYPANECAAVVPGSKPTVKPKPTRTSKPRPTRTAKPKPTRTAKPKPTRTPKPRPTTKPDSTSKSSGAPPPSLTAAPKSKPASESRQPAADSGKRSTAAESGSSVEPSRSPKSSVGSAQSENTTDKASESPGSSTSPTPEPSGNPSQGTEVELAEAGTGADQADRPLAPILLAGVVIAGLAGVGLLRRRMRG